jgi:hypothetical protein
MRFHTARVKTGKAQIEHKISALPPKTGHRAMHASTTRSSPAIGRDQRGHGLHPSLARSLLASVTMQRALNADAVITAVDFPPVRSWRTATPSNLHPESFLCHAAGRLMR